jgi:hypothetical protein
MPNVMLVDYETTSITSINTRTQANSYPIDIHRI